MLTINFKRGDTFALDGTYKPNGTVAPLPTGVRSQLRDSSGALVAELTVVRVDVPNGLYKLTFGDASTWVPGRLLYGDVQFTDATGFVESTVTFVVNVIADITHD